MKNKLSLRSRYLLYAVEKGYHADDKGIVFSPYGRILKLQLTNDGYYSFTVKKYGRSVGVKVHRLVAYQKYGDAMFEEGIVVRHLNGNPLDNSKDNIAIGTASDNMMDKSKEVRVAMATKAGRSKTDNYEEFWKMVKEEYDRGGISYNELAKKYNKSKSTLSYHLSKTAKRQTTFK